MTGALPFWDQWRAGWNPVGDYSAGLIVLTKGKAPTVLLAGDTTPTLKTFANQSEK